MAYYKSEENNYCGRRVISVADGTESSHISIKAPGPYKLDNITVSMEAAASGPFTVNVVKSGIEAAVVTVTLDSTKSFIVTDANIWLDPTSSADYLVVNNQSDQTAKVAFDFTY